MSRKRLTQLTPEEATRTPLTAPKVEPPSAQSAPVVPEISLGGGLHSPQALAASLNHATGARLSHARTSLLHLQRHYGNRYVQRVVAAAQAEPLVIQPKLVVGPAHDKYEAEADQVASRVMRMPEPVTGMPVQRRSATVSEAGFAVEPEIEQQLAQQSGGGQPLPENVRNYMEPRFGADFSGVHVHTDAQAHQLNESVQAQAFTTGQNIYFRRGAYAPGSGSGQHLLAHELTHVIQQTGLGSTPPTQGLKSGSQGQRKKVVQRAIKVKGKPQDLDTLLAQWKDDKEAQTILTSWHKVDLHDFDSDEALVKAVNNAKSKPKEPPVLYHQDSLKFVTKEKNRLPTLYFQSDKSSGRIRQQHKAGPYVKVEENKVDYFFPTQEDLDKFTQAAAAQMKKKFNPNLADYNAVRKPINGYFHCEVTYTDAENNIVANVHASGGQIDTNIKDYDDKKIKAIYQGAIGTL